jgi:hypothetical protein
VQADRIDRIQGFDAEHPDTVTSRRRRWGWWRWWWFEWW